MAEHRSLLEPAAIDADRDADIFKPSVAEVGASIAISLKRIADVLDGTAVGICVTETIFNPQTVRRQA